MEQLPEAATAAADRAASGDDPAAELADLFTAVARSHAADAAAKEAAASLGAYARGVDGRLDFTPGSAEHRAMEAIVRLLDLAIAAGSIRADLAPQDLLALVNGVPRDHASPEVRDRYIEIVLAGIRASQHQPRNP